MSKVSRREFIKGAAAAGVAGVGALGVLAGDPRTAQAAAPGTVPQKWDKETDVVVVGTGIAGLPAAIEAKAGGADVIVLEKEDLPGGASCTAGGHMILGATHIIATEGLQDSPEAWAEDEMKTGDYRGVPEVIRAYSTKGDETLRWFERLGVAFQSPRMNASPGHRINRSHWPAPSPNYPGANGLGEILMLLKELERMKVPVLVKHRMKSIYRRPNGPVLGVEVQTPTGTINIKARKAVILATGAFVDNARLCKAWDCRIVDANPGDEDFYGDMLEYKSQTGDGLLAAQAIGAGLTDMSFVSYVYIRFGTKRYVTWEPPTLSTLAVGGTGINAVGGANAQRCIMVKGDGSRFVNEALGGQDVDLIGGYKSDNWVSYERSPFVLAYITLMDSPRNAWAITDAPGAAAAKWPIDAMKAADPKKPPFGLWPDRVAIAATLQELAAKMKIPAAALEATVSRYNGFVDAGKDADFGKPTPLYKIATPPFYAARAAGLRHTQRNGLRINSKARVLELSDNWDGVVATRSIDQERVIPHLYAAGECSNVLGWRRPHGTMGIYATLGRFAGQSAAKEKPWT